MKTKQLIVETTKAGRNCYIVTEMFRGKCLRAYTHLGTLESLQARVELGYGLIK